MGQQRIRDPEVGSPAARQSALHQSPQAIIVSSPRGHFLATSQNAYLGGACGFPLLIKQDDMVCFSNFVRRAYEEYTLNAPRLSALPLLTRINVLNAFADNAKRLGIPADGLCRDDIISPFNLLGPYSLMEPQWACSGVPTVLQPTPLQRAVIHHPWIDLFPFPTMRDSMLRLMALGSLQDDEFCLDILELSDGDLRTRPAMLVWGDPSNCSSWEVNSAFLRKWGFLIENCPAIMESTNYWRAMRGEERVS